LKYLLLLLLGVLAIPVGAAEPLGFKGATLGSAITHIEQDPRFDCRVVRTPTADQICTLRPKEEETIAGVPVLALYYFYDRARLTGITISLPEPRFEAVARALQGKYGVPRVKVETVKNARGEAFENRTLSWRQGDALLSAERYAGRLDRSMVRLSDESAAERVRRRRAIPSGQDL